MRRPTRALRLALTVIAIAGALAVARAAAPVPDPVFVRWETFTRANGLPSDKVTAVTVDGARVWAGTEDGLAVLEKDAFRVIGTGDGLPFPVITALAVSERSGDLWIGTMGGLARLSGGRIDTFTQLDSGLVNDVVYGLAVDGDDVWIATAAGLNRYDWQLDVWEIFDTTNTLMHEPWCYAVGAAGGTVYVAVWGGGVLVRDGATGKFREHRDPDGEMEIDLFRDDGLVHDVTSAVSYGGGVLWVGTYFGLSRYDGRRWRSYGEEDSGLAGNFINFVRAWDGGIWVGTDQGLSRFDSETWHTWRAHPEGGAPELHITGPDGEAHARSVPGGPAGDMILGIDLAPDGIWLATASGLSHGVFRSSIPSSRHPQAGQGGQP